MRLKRSIYETRQILGISLTDKTHLSDLFDKSNFKNVKERYDSSDRIYLTFNLVHFLVVSSDFGRKLEATLDYGRMAYGGMERKRK